MDEAALLRFNPRLLAAQNDEWLLGGRSFSLQSMKPLAVLALKAEPALLAGKKPARGPTDSSSTVTSRSNVSSGSALPLRDGRLSAPLPLP